MPKNDWMRQGAIDVMRYLPSYLKKEPRFKATADTCSTEHDRLRLALQDLANNFFVRSATWAIPLFESFLALKPNPGDTDEVRRKRILLAFQGTETSTVERMNRIVNFFTKGRVEEHNEDYYFLVCALFMDESHFSALMESLETYKPAHLGIAMKLSGAINQTLHLGIGNRIAHHIVVYPQTMRRESSETTLYVAVTATFTEEITLEEQ